MNKHSHIYLYTFIHSGMTLYMTLIGTVSSRQGPTHAEAPPSSAPHISPRRRDAPKRRTIRTDSRNDLCV